MMATRPPLPQDNGTALIEAYDVERVLPDIDAHYGDRRADLLGHGVLLGFGAPSQLRLLAGQEHGRAIPLPDLTCMIAIKKREECDLFCTPLAWATRTTIVITSAWIAMLTTLTPPPTKNCRNMLGSQRFVRTLQFRTSLNFDVNSVHYA
jgi:hypothetical protein